MYIYIDESGNFGWPLKAGSEPYMLFSVLVIEDRKSKHAIEQAISRTMVDLRKHHPGYKNDPSKRIVELKGSKELSDRPDVRLRFFKLIAKKANFHIYAVILDKRILTQKLSENYMERYSMLLLNILYAIPIPKNQKRVIMVVDSQAKAEPTQPLKVRYSSKAKRLRQKRARAQDINRRNQYTQMITSVFKRFLTLGGTHLKVWHIRSYDDHCLQAVDIISHFIYQRLKLDEERESLYQSLSYEERRFYRLKNNRQWQKNKKERGIWFEAYEVLKPKIQWIRRPKRLQRHMIDKLARLARGYERQNRRGNREA